MAPNPRVVNAFSAMKALGIHENIVKPVLKQLLKVFDKNWEPIEEENYRALADAVFEYQENEILQKGKPNNSNEDEDAQMNDEYERPLKRTRRPQVGQGTTSLGNYDTVGSASYNFERRTELEHIGASENSPIKHPDIEGTPSRNANTPGNKYHSIRAAKDPGNVERKSSPLTRLAQCEKSIASHPVVENGAQMHANAVKAIQANPNSSTYLKEIGKRTVCDVPSKERIPICESPSQAICLKEPKVEPGISHSSKTNVPNALVLIQPKEEPFIDCATNFSQSQVESQVPSPRAHRNSPQVIDSSSGDCPADNNGDLRTTASPCFVGGNIDSGCPTNSNKRAGFGHADRQKVSSFDLESASSPLGEVRISLSCMIPCQTDFHLPSVDAILKMAEEKCVKTCNINTNFSARQLLRDVCDSFLELGSKSKESQVPNSCTNDRSTAKCDGGSFVQNQSAGTVNFKVVVSDVNSTLLMGATNDCDHHADNLSVNRSEETNNGVESNGHDNNSVHSMALVVAEGFLSFYLADLTDGEERVEISLVNEINNKCLPTFKYVPHNVVYENACLDISLSRIGDGDCCKACIGDCLTVKNPCACASRTGGGFAYTLDGLLNEDFLEESESIYCDRVKHLRFCSKSCPLVRTRNDELSLPCNGHLARKFIKECWRKCGCSKMCGNRLIQRGITRNLQVFMASDRKGWGLRTLEDLPKGAFVCEYAGEVLTLKEMHNRYTHNASSPAYLVLLDAVWDSEKTLKDESTICLDGTDYGNIARFINHRCSDSNLIDIPIEMECPDLHYYRIALFTRRKVNALEELTWDYGIDFQKNCNPVKTFRCQCGSKYCRDTKMA